MKTLEQLVDEGKMTKGLISKFVHVANHVGMEVNEPKDIVIEKLRVKIFDYINRNKFNNVRGDLEFNHFEIAHLIKNLPKCSKASARAIADLMMPSQKSDYKFAYMNSIESGRK